MHELSICQGLVDIVLKESDSRKLPPGAVRKVVVAAGIMHQVMPDSLQFYYELLTRDTPAAGSVLELKVIPVSARCNACGWEGELKIPCFRCGACDSSDLAMRTGRELHLESMDIETA